MLVKAEGLMWPAGTPFAHHWISPLYSPPVRCVCCPIIISHCSGASTWVLGLQCLCCLILLCCLITIIIFHNVSWYVKLIMNLRCSLSLDALDLTVFQSVEGTFRSPAMIGLNDKTDSSLLACDCAMSENNTVYTLL